MFELCRVATEVGESQRRDAAESSGRTRYDQTGGDCDQSHQLGDEPTEQREQSQTACRLSSAESRRRWADRPRATQRPRSHSDLSYPVKRDCAVRQRAKDIAEGRTDVGVKCKSGRPCLTCRPQTIRVKAHLMWAVVSLG